MTEQVYIDVQKETKKNIPKTISLVLIAILVITLPLVVWAVATQRFLIKKEAQEVETIGQKTNKVLVIEFNPILSGGQKLNVYKNWNNPQTLELSYIQELKNLSGNYADYQIVQRIVVDAFPKLNDGFLYTESVFLECLSNPASCHNPWLVDYLKILNDYGVCDRVNSGEINELWLWGGPYFGYWEAIMTGPGAFSTNAPPLVGSNCTKNLHIMGFNYERGVSEMVEDFGHRFEGTMRHVFTNKGINFWTNYTKNNLSNPGEAACGTLHIPPNGTRDYDWSNTNAVSNTCDDWSNYPNLSGSKKTFGCEAWGCNGMGWKRYWLSHIPKAVSSTSGTWNNWWKYILDYEVAVGITPQPTPTPTPTPTSNATPTPNVTPTPNNTETPSSTPTLTPTPTPSPTNRATLTPGPTRTPIPTTTPTPSAQPSSFPVPVSGSSWQSIVVGIVGITTIIFAIIIVL